MHESQMHTENIYITLTYKDSNIPPYHSLKHQDFQKFIRALRQKTKQKIRYYMCGEYGDETARPHYHAIIFGYEFPDAYFWCEREGNRIYRSELLESLWTKGNSEIGSVTFRSAAYVARYIMKKVNGKRAEEKYQIIDVETGEYFGQRKPEYTAMSGKPGIGKSWYQKFKSDIFPSDECVIDGRKHPAPKYYRRLLEKEDPALYKTLRKIRIGKSKDNPNNTPERLATREVCQTKKAEKLIRPFL